MPRSRWSGLARVGQHRLSSGSAHGLLGVAQACSAPSDTSRDSQFGSTSSKCESHGREHIPSALLAKDGCNGLYGRFHAHQHPPLVHNPLHLVPCANLVRRVTLSKLLSVARRTCLLFTPHSGSGCATPAGSALRRSGDRGFEGNSSSEAETAFDSM